MARQAAGTTMRGKRRSGKKPTRSDEVLAAAVHHFATEGYQAASMHEIGESLGLLKGSIYYYVTSKEELLFTVIRSVHDEMMLNLEKAEAREGDVASRIRAFLEDLVALTIQRSEYAGIFQREFRHLSEEHQAIIRKERRRYERHLENLLTEGQRAGTVRSDVDAKLLSVASLTMITAIPTWYQRDRGPSMKSLTGTYVELTEAIYRPLAE